MARVANIHEWDSAVDREDSGHEHVLVACNLAASIPTCNLAASVATRNRVRLFKKHLISGIRLPSSFDQPKIKSP